MSVFEITLLVNGKGLRLAGELDLAAAPRLTEALLDFAPAVRHLDLTEVSFLDSSGLRVILALARSRGDNGSVVLLDPTAAIESSRSRGSTSIRGSRYGTRAPSRYCPSYDIRSTLGIHGSLRTEAEWTAFLASATSDRLDGAVSPTLRARPTSHARFSSRRRFRARRRSRCHVT